MQACTRDYNSAKELLHGQSDPLTVSSLMYSTVLQRALLQIATQILVCWRLVLLHSCYTDRLALKLAEYVRGEEFEAACKSSADAASLMRQNSTMF